MKIDEACIDHNAVKLINKIMGNPYEYGDQDKFTDHLRLLTLGGVRGVIDMVEAMKKVMKGEEDDN